MSYPPAKRQRSNTSREAANGTPQTIPPSLRHSHINQSLNLYPSGYENGGYSLQPATRQPVNYDPYSTNAVTAPNGGYGGPYQTPTNGYGAGSYSPQQANNFAPQYATQSPSNGHLTPSNGHMTYHNATFHQQQRPNPATTTMQHQHQQVLADYAESYAPQPTTHVASYHTNPNTYPDASVLNSHFSPATLSSPAPIPSPVHLPTPAPQNENMHTPEDEFCEEEEDAMGETADESAQVYTHPEPPRMTAPISMPTPSVESSCKGGQENNRCSCKTGRGNKKPCKSCVCSKFGLGCTSSCSCGDACGNIFANLTQFFGPKSMFSKPCGANACFATWLCNQPSIEDLEMDLMIDIMLNDDISWATIRECTEPFKKWEESWKKARSGKRKKMKEDRERLEFELLRGGLGNCNQDDFHGYWYSFCRGSWVPADSWYHCQECRVCKPNAEWHCDKHNRCTQNRVCQDCASAPYADMMQTYADPGS